MAKEIKNYQGSGHDVLMWYVWNDRLDKYIPAFIMEWL